MTAKSKSLVIEDRPGERKVHLPREIGRAAGGSQCDDFNARILETLLPCVWVVNAAEGARRKTERKVMVAAIAAMTAFEPQDEIEAMVAAQAVAMHAASLECLRRALLPEQPAEIASKLRKDGVNLARAMTDMMAALDRKRGKGQQHIRVERVVVHEGGQAIVGDVTSGSAPRVGQAVAPRAIEACAEALADETGVGE